MTGSDLTSVILLGLACAANPWGIMVAVLLLNARRGLWVVWAYVAAWIGSISVVMAVLLMGFGQSSASSSTRSTIASFVEIAIGILLLAFGVGRLLRARRGSAGEPDAEQEQPGWLRAIEQISIISAFLLGIYSATYPMVVAAAGEILRDDVSTTEEILLAVIFVILGSSTVVGVAALGTFVPSRSAPFLARMRAWLTVHNAAVLTAIILVFGLALTVRGFQSL
jgi:hypothetical protein